MITTPRSLTWSLTTLNNSLNAALHTPRSSPSQHGVSFLTQMPGDCQGAVILQVPSVRLTWWQTSRQFRLSCPPEFLTCDRQLHDVAQLDLFDTREPHRFFTTPVNCLLRSDCHWFWLHGNSPSDIRFWCCRRRRAFASARLRSVLNLHSPFVIWDRPLLPLLSTATGRLRRWRHEQSPLRVRFCLNWIFSRFWCCWFCFWHCYCGPVTSLFPLLSSPYLFGQCLVNHLMSSIQPFCSMRSGSEAFFDSRPAAIWVCLCSFVVFDCITTWDSPSGFVLPQNGNGGIGMVHSNFRSVYCPLFLRHPPRYSNHTVDNFCVPSVLRLQSPNFTSSENTICVPNEALCAVVSHPEPNHELLPGVHSVPSMVIFLASTFSPNGTNSCVGCLPMASFHHDLSGIWTGCIRRAPPTMVRQVSHRWVVLASCFRYGTGLFW